MRQLKHFFGYIFILSLILAGVGYYKGLRLNNYREFISGIVNEHWKNEVSTSDNKKQKRKSIKQGIKPSSNNLDILADNLRPLPQNPFADIDRYARQFPIGEDTDLDDLSNYLQKGAKSDLEKARAIYVWLTANIDYDDDLYNSDDFGNTSAEVVLIKRKTVCDGFSNLFLALGQRMDLEIEKVVGYAKGYGYTNGMEFNKKDGHAWNAIKIEGNWSIFDATWGQGYGDNINGKLKSTKKFNDYWFNVNPYEAIFNHFPDDSKYAFVQPNLTLDNFRNFPRIESSYFEIGFNGRDTYKELLKNVNAKYPESYNLETFCLIKKAPSKESLLITEPLEFEFFIPRAYSVAIIDASDNWTYFNKENGKFSLKYAPQIDGKLSICVLYENKTNPYYSLLTYNVVKKGNFL